VTLTPPPDRDHGDVEALVADRYLDALLATGDGRPPVLVAGDLPVAPGLRTTIETLRRSLVRVHPSFRFEERLALRLADLAAAQAAPAIAAGGTGAAIIPFPGTRDAAGDLLLGPILAGELDPADDAALMRERALARVGPDRRPLLVGGAAITSAAISIVGVAFVAWRASRPGSRPIHSGAMARAARLARARRAALAPIGFPGGSA
jgi:hypothetical protein